MITVVFHREEGWYLTEYPWDYENWQEEADRNPGTLKIETIGGHVLWQLNSTP